MFVIGAVPIQCSRLFKGLECAVLSMVLCTMNNPCIYSIRRHFGYERVYLPLYKVADTPFHIQGDEEHRAYTRIQATFCRDIVMIVQKPT